MSELISRNEIIDILAKMQFFQGQRAGRELWNNKSVEVQDEDIKNFNRDIQTIRKYILQLEEKSKWITVSEMLPDESFEGLEWTMDEDGKPIACDVLVTFVSESENNKRYVTDATFFPDLELSESFTVDDVIAWMPPEPYKGDRK